MSAGDAFELIKMDLEVHKKLGTKELSIEQIEKWLAGLAELAAKDPPTFNTVVVERVRADNELIVQVVKRDADHDLELLRSLVVTSGNAAKAGLFINGGAAVAVLAFIGHLVTTGKLGAIGTFALPLSSFAAGVLLSALTSGLIYVVQWAFYKKRSTTRVRVMTIVVQALSFVAFLVGCVSSLRAFLALVH